METLDIIPGNLHMLQRTSQPATGHMMQFSGKQQPKKHIVSSLPDMAPSWSLSKKSKPVQPLSVYPCIYRPKQISIKKSDLDQQQMMAPALRGEEVVKQIFLIKYQYKKQSVNLFDNISAFS